MISSPGSEIPSHRACAHCRSQKVRCLPDDGNPDVCQRCARAGRQCVFTPLQKRKQRKRTDTRVAELEREMRAMRSMLKKKQEGAGSAATTPEEEHHTHPRQPRSIWFGESADSDAAPNENVSIHPIAQNRPTTSSSDTESLPSPAVPLWPTKYHQPRPQQQRPDDVVDRGIISMATARSLFQTYREDLFPHYPIVAIPDNVTADEMRETKPTLFLSIIAAAAGKENSDLAAILDQDVLQAYATRSLVHSEKSLELVQALLISSLWYHPPQKFGQLKYYEYIHMAASMAIDLGIGTRPASQRARGRRHDVSTPELSTRALPAADDISTPSSTALLSRSRDQSPDSASLESRRTLVACYIICAGVSVSLRRPNMLRASNYIRDCADFLERSSAALPTDRTLAAWVKLMIIADEIGTSFAYDDPGDIASISDLRTQIMLKDFRARLTSWYSAVTPNIVTGSLRIMYHTVRLYLHEIALHIEHSPDDFRAPYQMSAIIPPDDDVEVPTHILADTLAQCIQASHDLLDTFISIEPNSLRALPVFSFVRVSFGAFVLAKLILSMGTPNSRIGQLIDRERLQVHEHLERAIEHARAVINPARCRVPTIFLALLLKVRQWCRQPELLAHMMSDENACLFPPHGDVPTFEKHALQLVQGPRVIEQPSSSENSPQAQSGHLPSYSTSMNAIDASSDWQKVPQPSITQVPAQDPSSTFVDPAANLSNFGLNSEPTSYLPSDGSYLPPADPMQLDPELLQLWSEMNAGGANNGFPEGGLTGLDDWAAMPMQMMGVGVTNNVDDFDWPRETPPNPSEGGGMNFTR